MDDFLKLLDKLDEYYKTMCSGIIDCDLCEVINLLDDYGKYDVFFKIRPIIDNEDKEEYIDENYIDDEDEFYEDEFLEYEDIKDLYKQINDYDDEQLFEIEIPDEILDIYISKEFRSLIFSTEFNDYQREKIIKIC